MILGRKNLRTSVIKELNNVIKMFEIIRTVILKNSSNPKAYLGLCQASIMEIFIEIS